jgi:hypothetical protein
MAQMFGPFLEARLVETARPMRRSGKWITHASNVMAPEGIGNAGGLKRF